METVEEILSLYDIELTEDDRNIIRKSANNPEAVDRIVEKFKKKHEDAESSKTVQYQRSEDGEAELCERRDRTARTVGLCHHCDCSIAIGDPISLLTTKNGVVYRMHQKCTDKGCGL